MPEYPAGQTVGVLLVVRLHEQVLVTALVCVQAGAGPIVYLVVILPVLEPDPQAAVVGGEAIGQTTAQVAAVEVVQALVAGQPNPPLRTLVLMV